MRDEWIAAMWRAAVALRRSKWPGHWAQAHSMAEVMAWLGVTESDLDRLGL